MTFQRAPKPNLAQQEKDATSSVAFNINATLQAVTHDKVLNVHANVYEYAKLYQAAGQDLDSEYRKRPVSQARAEIIDNFTHNKTHKLTAELAEMLPLYANQPGRLGDFIEARVTKTARPDDQGNSFVDIVLEIRNKFLATKEAIGTMKDVPEKMTFLIDMTTGGGESLAKKQASLQETFLVRGKKANVLCYKDSFGKLGTEQPKIVVTKSGDYMERVGATLGSVITQHAADSFSITNPRKFDEEYRKFFLEFVRAIGENAQQNITYIESLEPDTKRAELAREYKKIVAFTSVYEKTPVTRTKGS